MVSAAHTLVVSGRQWLAAGILLALLPFAWLSNILLIPRVGPVGAAMSLALGLGAGAAIIGIIVWRRFGGLVQFSTLLRIGLATAAALLPGLLIPGSGILVFAKIGLMGMVHIAVLILTREVTAGDLGIGKSPRTPPPPTTPRDRV